MSWFTGLIKGAVSLFVGSGSSSNGANNVMTVAKGVGSWIDGQQLTEQEKAEFNAEMVKNFGEFMAQTVNENTERSKTRREIAILIIKAFLLWLFISGIVYPFDKSWAEYWFKLATGETMGLLVLGVGAFFFGVHMLRTYQSK